MKKSFTIVVQTENTSGLLVRLAGIFSRRRTQILSLYVDAAEEESRYRFAIAIKETEEATIQLIRQIDKQVDVYASTYYVNEEVGQQA